MIPVYNVEDYLQETLDSVAAQTVFDKTHVILVDDGSTDSSYEIATAFAELHPNVTAIQQENAGPGVARNRAMDMAETPYIAFCDSDDLMPPGALERLLKAIVEHGASMSVGKMDTFPKPTKFLWHKYFGKGDRLLESIADAPDFIHAAGPCHKVFDLRQLRAHGLRFGEGVHFEDAFLAIPMMLHAKGIALVDEEVYKYRRRPTQDSIMDSLFIRPQNYWDHLELVRYLGDMRPQLDAFKHEALERFLVRSYQGFAVRASEIFEDEADLRKIFETCQRLYEGIDVSFILRWTADTRHRVPFVAYLLDDFELFTRPQEKLRGVCASSGDLYLDYPVPARLLPLTRISRVDAVLEQTRLTPAGDELEVSGHLILNGMPLSEPLTTNLAVRVRGSGLSVPAQPQFRRDLTGSSVNQKEVRNERGWAGFTARIPVNQLRSGEHQIRVVFLTSTGQASRRCRMSAAFLRDARVITAGGRRILCRFTAPDIATMVIRNAGTKADDRRWKRELLRRDLGHVRHRRPLWKWRLLRAATERFMRNRDIWLIGERPDTAQDNSAHLFRYLRTKARRKDTYFLLAKDAADPQGLRKLGKVVKHGSLRHRFLLLHAKKLINSYDIDSYMLPPRWTKPEFLKHLNWRIGASRVFLQHGVTDKDVSRGLHRARTNVDLFVAAAHDEAEFVGDQLGYGDVAQPLGFPRFDALTPDNGNRKILFMPTWRVYLVAPSYDPGRTPKVRFEGSAYHTFLVGLFGSEKLRMALKEHGYTLEFLPHYELRSLVTDIVPDDKSFAMVDQSTRSVQDAMRQADLFVTDWSSTAFDVAYLGTPLVYAQFDPDEYWAGHYRKGYFDAARDGFGPVCHDAEQTVDAIVRYLENGCKREEEYSNRANSFFAHRDRENCARVADAIAALGSARAAAEPSTPVSVEEFVATGS
ncbi:CDP-glycerol glycerophosphotransferase family protein [Actinoplanes sp. OR16]|uniref:bifunctional glycosyltransferase/CDP-glycerol:glycerophosphate glycerophosphotransferase n=1 Tax=Actinoplanes sp. OR16 TaxID=946334 RepID=UPI00135F1AB1|nr:CDP-glycerol glycerophosphotransferase family protein [Actinoplanes sp. OR16]